MSQVATRMLTADYFGYMQSCLGANAYIYAYIIDLVQWSFLLLTRIACVSLLIGSFGPGEEYPV